MPAWPRRLRPCLSTERTFVELPDAASAGWRRLAAAIARAAGSGVLRSGAGRIAAAAACLAVAGAWSGWLRGMAMDRLLLTLARVAVLLLVVGACVVAEEIAHAGVVFAKGRSRAVAGVRLTFVGVGRFPRVVLASIAVVLRGEWSPLDELHVRFGGTFAYAFVGTLSFVTLWLAGIIESAGSRPLFLTAGLLLSVLPAYSLLPHRFAPTGDGRRVWQIARLLGLDSRSLASECARAARMTVSAFAPPPRARIEGA